MSEQVQSGSKMYGRVFITCYIETVTGLHIGGSDEGIQIGGIDNTVIRNPFNNEPYIPGSSLRGRMRSELEKLLGLAPTFPIGRHVSIHICEDEAAYTHCGVCRIFGVPGAMPREQAEAEESARAEFHGGPTRLIVRDVALTRESHADLIRKRTDLPFTEVKTEAAIDRVTSAAVPRPMERVPAGVLFGPAQLVFSVFGEQDFDLLENVFKALRLVEDSYLGGQGSRGSGQVRFQKFEILARTYVGDDVPLYEGIIESLPDLETALEGIIEKARQAIPMR